MPRRNPAPRTAEAGYSAVISTHDYPLTPAPRYATGGHAGSYRLADGSWHTADVYGPHMPNRVRLRPESLANYAVFWPRKCPPTWCAAIPS